MTWPFRYCSTGYSYSQTIFWYLGIALLYTFTQSLHLHFIFFLPYLVSSLLFNFFAFFIVETVGWWRFFIYISASNTFFSLMSEHMVCGFWFYRCPLIRVFSTFASICSGWRRMAISIWKHSAYYDTPYAIAEVQCSTLKGRNYTAFPVARQKYSTSKKHFDLD